MAILKKLLDIQKQNISIKKDKQNEFFKSNYATLNEVLSKIKKPLNDAGIVILQIPQRDGLITKLIDTTEKEESFVECFMPYVETTTAQKLGSCNTYNRRYSLVTLLGLEDDDDDGNIASESGIEMSAKPKQYPKKNYDRKDEEII
jgi:hypothetical protein